MNNNVKHPKHYCTGKIECIEYIKDMLGDKGFVDYCIGNVTKYITRYSIKNGSEDLKKAMQYLIWAEQTYEEVEQCTLMNTVN